MTSNFFLKKSTDGLLRNDGMRTILDSARRISNTGSPKIGESALCGRRSEISLCR